jgi:Uma2 family endonuclease
MVASRQYLSPEAYLALERDSIIKHEYRNGQIYAMAGASNNHGAIVINLAAILRNRLRGTSCRPYAADTKARIEAKNTYYYPDLIVSCDPRESGFDDFLRYPCLIIEVLSDTTEAFDRGDKFADYRTLETLQEYVLISQTKIAVDIFRRNENGLWVLTPYEAEDNIQLISVEANFEIAELYEDVEFEPDGEQQSGLS